MIGSTCWEQCPLVMANHCLCLYWLSSCPLVSHLLTNLPYYNFLLILTNILDALNTGSTTIIIPPLTVIERQLKEDCLRYGIKVLVGSEVSSEFSKPPQFVTSLMAPLYSSRQQSLRRATCLKFSSAA